MFVNKLFVLHVYLLVREGPTNVMCPVKAHCCVDDYLVTLLNFIAADI